MHRNSKAAPNISETAKLYQVYRTCVAAPGGRPPFWLTALELATFREIHASAALREAMEELSRDFAQHEQRGTGRAPALRDLLDQLDDAPVANALLAYGVWRSRERHPDDYERQIRYARTFEVLGEMLARLEAARTPAASDGGVPGGGFAQTRAANDGGG